MNNNNNIDKADFDLSKNLLTCQNSYSFTVQYGKKVRRSAHFSTKIALKSKLPINVANITLTFENINKRTNIPPKTKTSKYI